MVSTWSSGTGGSGVLGALSFAALTTAGLSARKTVLLMLVVPVLMAITFFIILEHDQKRFRTHLQSDWLFLLRLYHHISIITYILSYTDNFSDSDPLIEERPAPNRRIALPQLNMKAKCQLLPRMSRFIIPLGLVYLFEYFINQGLV